ncbi:MAG: uridine kinase [SAR324 cluster bacterium]|nr:uridine kinase [SAR324 cluster bacterium]MBF0349771.1 uridine kinase [SAR324 cluster bacterium]
MKIIAVAGGSGCGKSLFAHYLQERLPKSNIIALDNFYQERPDHIPMEKYNFDIPSAFDFKLFHQALEDLSEGVPAHIPMYEYGTGKRKRTTTKLIPGEFLIIEGLYVLMSPSLRGSLTYSFYLESPPDVALGRRILRDHQERTADVEYTLNQYFTFVRPAYYTHILPTKQYANMVIENDIKSRLDLFLDDFFSKYTF